MMSIELAKRIAAVVVAALFLLFLFATVGWPMIRPVWESANTTFTTDNATYGNYTGLSMGVRATPILLFFGLGIVPILAIVVVVWAWRTGKFGGY